MANDVLHHFDATTHWVNHNFSNDTRVNLPKLLSHINQKRNVFLNPNTQRFMGYLQQLSHGPGGEIFVKNGCIHLQANMEGIKEASIEDHLKGLSPWRKGPFQVGNVLIDSEWRSNMKWDRFEPYFSSLKHKKVLDIGCGNGYYMFRMLEHHPNLVVGIDPSHLTYFQFHAMRHMSRTDTLHYLPVGWNACEAFSNFFDVVCCMGILYHHRSPMDILSAIRQAATKKVTLLLDTLIIDGNEDVALFPKDRYANMPNVYFIPTVPCLTHMLARSGFKNIDVLSVDQTSVDEQRATPWSFEFSLQDGLNPKNTNETIEGYPAPRRVALVATL
jgi:tRNA (mo5U34)-methyltransferase